MRHVTAGIVLALVTAACGPGDTTMDSFTVRDSAGIQVAESRAGVWGAEPGFAVDSVPETRIGTVEGEEAYRFYRITDGTRLSDGRVLVADAGSGQVRSFDPDGVHRWTVGGLGEAPGEFRSITGLSVSGDSVTAFDRGASRLTTYSLSGDFIGTRPVSTFAATVPMAAGSVRFLADGRVFGIDANTMAPGTPPALVRDTAFVFEILEPGGGTGGALAAIPAMWTQSVAFDGQPGFRPQPLTSEPSWDAHGMELYLTSGETFEFSVVTTDGRVVRIVRRLEPVPTVTEQDAQSWRDVFLARAPDAQRSVMTAMLAAFTMPTHLPAYARLLVDPEGYVWLGRFLAPGITVGPEWDVYAPDGAYLGPVRMPEGVEVFEIGLDYIVAKWTDDMDIEYIQVHRLLRHPDPN